MSVEHFDQLPQGITRWQLTLCLTAIAAAYLCVAWMDGQDEKRAECLAKGQSYSDSLDVCLKELKHATPEAY